MPTPGLAYLPNQDDYESRLQGALPAYPGLANLFGNVVSHIANIPQRAFQASETYRQGGEYDPGPVMDAAGLAMTGGIGGGVGGPALGSGPIRKGGIRAYHGSPYDFDKFDISKVGTGEGAQAYGHGLYFAENPEVADIYSRVVTASKAGGGWSGTRPPVFDAIPKESLANIPDNLLGRIVASWQSNGDDVAKNLTKRIFEENRGKPYSDALHGLAYAEWKPAGHRYEVNINARPEDFLNWDKPLSEQSDYVREIFNSPERMGLKPSGPIGERGWFGYTDEKNKLIGRAMTKSLPTGPFDDREIGMSLYRGAGSWKPLEATDRLKGAGIPGIRYLDQGSRSYGEGTHNYVVFDPSIVDILRKYGIAGLAALPATGAYMSNQQTQ